MSENDENERVQKLTEREVVEDLRVGRDVEYGPEDPDPARTDDGFGVARQPFPITDSGANAKQSWTGDSPAHAAREEASEKNLPFYKKTWFWVVVLVVIVIFFSWLMLCGFDTITTARFWSIHSSIPNTVIDGTRGFWLGI